MEHGRSMATRHSSPHSVKATEEVRGKEAAEKALRESEDRFRRLHIGVLVFSDRGRLIASNSAALELLGRSRSELAGLVTVPPETMLREDGSPMPPQERPVTRALAMGRPVRNAVMGVVRPRTGDTKWLLFNVEPEFDERGVVKRVACAVFDITDRKAMEDALRASEERFRAMFASAPIGIEVMDIDGQIIGANQALLSMLGFTEEELIGQHWSAIKHPEDVAREVGFEAELVGGERESYQVESRMIRKDSEVVWTRLCAAVVRTAAGKTQFTIGMVEDISEQKEFEEQLQHQALHDGLTSLPNRLLLQDRLERAIAFAQREETEVALLLMDLNNFKDINDTFGHHYGDLVLETVASRLQSAVRARDTVARLGGDEFAILLPETGVAGAADASDKLLACFDDPIIVDGEAIATSASIGIAVYPQQGNLVSILLRHADVAMYVAKRAGGGWQLYDSSQDEYSPQRLTLLAELRRAIATDQLELHFQPIKSCLNDRTVAVEALLRWRHPQRGIIQPDAFIPLAERSGMIRPLTLWVVNAALRQSRRWREAGLAVQVGVNLSARSLHDGALFDQIERLLRHWSPAHLAIEITESAVMTDPDRSPATLARLHELGVSILVDDFGTGYSSLAYLQRLPVDDIKIDRSFVSDMVTNDGNLHIVRATISLAHGLGLGVVAEGVEDRATQDALATLGCDRAQGFYVGRPMTANDCTTWLEDVVTCSP